MNQENHRPKRQLGVLDLAHRFLREHVRPGDIVIDAVMGNTGEVKWLMGAAEPEKGCVYLKAESEGKARYFPIDGDTEFLSEARARVRIPAGEAGSLVTLRLCVYGVAEFGQKAEITIID